MGKQGRKGLNVCPDTEEESRGQQMPDEETFTSALLGACVRVVR